MEHEARKLKVLLIAFHCAPDGGSVSMIGYHWARYLQPHVDLHLVTHVRHQQDLSNAFDAQFPISYVDTEWFSRPFYSMANRLVGRSQGVLFMVGNLDFLYFAHKAMKMLRPIHARQKFDIVHVATPVTPVAPHHFGLLGPPTLLGPLNGGLPMLKGFPEIGNEERAWMYRLRMTARLLTRMYGTFRHADLILSATRSNDRELGPGLSSKTYRMCENGVDSVAETVPPMPPMPPTGPLKILFVGRIVPIKGLRMLLDALHGVLGVELTIVGSGPQEAYLKKRVATLKMGNRVRFMGQKKSAELSEFYRGYHLHVLPSVRESGGATILEAMAEGRPTLALNQGGPSEYITPKCGILLPCNNSDQVISDLRATLKEIREEPAPLLNMARECLHRAVKHYTWDAKVREILDVYHEYASQERTL